MRHSFAMQRLNEGFPLNEVSAVLGHSNLQTTVS
ncbi:MAG: tyrosine-type recombinase/integrase [Thermodesulfobacteriota bacterium]